MKKRLRDLIGQGKTKQTLQQLNRFTENDEDLQAPIAALAARYEKYLQEKHASTLDEEALNIELNRIHAAALHLIDKLPTGLASSGKKWSWEKIALWVGIFAGIAGITGYTLKDFFAPEEEPIQITEPVATEPAPDTVYTPPKEEKVTATPPKKAPKNNTNIEVNDQGKVGTVIIGDSNKIDIKQDF